jgi:hypothetical protein
LKTSNDELSDLVSLTNADLEATINAARHAEYEKNNNVNTGGQNVYTYDDDCCGNMIQ